MADSMKFMKSFIKKMDTEIEHYISKNNTMPTFTTIYSLPPFNLDDADWEKNMYSIYTKLKTNYDSKHKTKNDTEYETRPYQQQYIKKSIKKLYKYKSIVLHAPTGSGKTYMIMKIIAKMYDSAKLELNKLQKNVIILFVSPLLDINDQCVANKYLNIIGNSFTVCKINSRHGFNIDLTTINNNIIISTTYLSLSKVVDILDTHNKHAVFAIFDECHTITTSCQTILSRTKRLHYTIYASATPLDEQKANSCPHLNYGRYIRLVSEKELMELGYLAHLNTYIAKPTHADNNISIVHAISKFIKHTKSSYICCFVNSKKNGIQLSELFEKYMCDVNVYLYFSGDKSKILYDFVNDTCIKKIIISCKKLCMGVDIPCIDSIIFVDNKMSYTEISQCIGRGLRSYILPSGENKVCSLLLFEGNSNNNILQYLKYMQNTCGYNIIRNSDADKATKPIIQTESVNISLIADYDGTLNVSISLYDKYTVDKLDNIYMKYRNIDMTQFNTNIHIHINCSHQELIGQILLVNVANKTTHQNFINSVIYRIYKKQNGIWGFKNTLKLKHIFDKLHVLNYALMFDNKFAYLFTISSKNIDTDQQQSSELWSEAWKSACLHIHLNIIKAIKLDNPRLLLNKTLDYSDKYNWQGPSLLTSKNKIDKLLNLFSS